MNLQSIASHTVDLDLLPTAPTVLDVGCRWFDFSKQILELRPQARIVALDPAPDVYDEWKHTGGENERRIRFWPYGLTETNKTGRRRMAHFSTGEGDFLTDAESYHDAVFHTVSCIDMQTITKAFEIPHWDLVKLDCEGSEFGILENWPGAVATQISVEFHDWDKPAYKSVSYYDSLWRKLPWYRTVQHDLTKQGDGVGHWDSLLVLRNGK